MPRSRITAISLGILIAGSWIASAARAQESFIARLLEPTYDPAVYAADELDEDQGAVEQAAMWLQQPAWQPAPSLDTARRSTRGSRQGNVGLASVPNMFG